MFRIERLAVLAALPEVDVDPSSGQGHRAGRPLPRSPEGMR